jgi:MFS family permease
MIASIVTLTLLQLTFREPVLQFRLLSLGIPASYAGLFFALDLIGYIGVSLTLSRLPSEKKNLTFLVYLSMFLAVFGLFFIGTIHFIGLPDSIFPLVVGILINGTAGALCINNSVAAMINILNITYANRGELVNNIASGIFASCFSLGEMLGPICGSVLTSLTGGFSSGVFVVNILIAVVTVLTTYHLAGDVLCCGEPAYAKLGRVPGKHKKVSSIDQQKLTTA